MIKNSSVYVCSFSGFCGKTVISLGLALNLQELGYKVGYFKPIGWTTKRGLKGEKIDEDAQLMTHILEPELSMDSVVPVLMGDRFLEETGEVDPRFCENEILAAYGKITEGKDFTIIEGPQSFGIGSCIGLDPISLSTKFNSPILVVLRFDGCLTCTVDQAVWLSKVIDAFGSRLMGVIINRVPRTEMERVRRLAYPIFEHCKIDILGIVPENMEVLAPTVREICEHMPCEVLTAEDKLDYLVEDLLVGAMSPESFLSYSRRSFRKAVITGGDRTDIQLAALETSLSALILTGNLYPDARVLSRAEELEVPVLLVSGDTYSTVRHISDLTGRINPKDEKKINLAKMLVREHVRWESVFKPALK